MAFHPDDIYVARDENDLFRVVTDGGNMDESGLAEADVFYHLECWEIEVGTLHVFDPAYPRNRSLWETPIGSAQYNSYMAYIDQKAWEKGQT